MTKVALCSFTFLLVSSSVVIALQNQEPLVERKHSKPASINPCVLNVDDLTDLFEIIKKSFQYSEHTYFSISTELKDGSIDSKNYEAFLAYKELPGTLTNLSIYAAGYDSEDRLIKELRIYFYEDSVSLTVNGLDDIWVRGTNDKIRDFLSDKKPWYGFMGNPWYFFGVLLVFQWLSIVAIFVSVYVYVPSSGWRVIILIIVTIALITVYNVVLNAKQEGLIFPYSIIYITPKKPFLNLSNYELITIVLAICAITVPIILHWHMLRKRRLE